MPFEGRLFFQERPGKDLDLTALKMDQISSSATFHHYGKVTIKWVVVNDRYVRHMYYN